MARRDRSRTFLAISLVLLVLLSGCVGKGETGRDEDDLDTASGGDGTGTGGDANTTDPPPKNGTADPQGPDSNTTDPDPGNGTTDGTTNNTTTPTQPKWPAIGDAKVRPGVRHSMKIGDSTYWCTTNFVYRSIANDTLYLGTAAHCVDGLPIGSDITVYGVDYKTAFLGRLAYSSWYAMAFEPQPTTVGDDLHPHDFALIEVPAEHREKVHPATLHYGGPTALGDLKDVRLGTRVMVYGNSVTRPGVDASNWEEGLAYGTDEETKAGHKGTSVLALVPQAIQGDSGSGLMTKDGKALGAASAASFGVPYGYWMTYSSIPHAVAFLQAQGWDIELQTWELLPTLI